MRFGEQQDHQWQLNLAEMKKLQITSALLGFFLCNLVRLRKKKTLRCVFFLCGFFLVAALQYVLRIQHTYSIYIVYIV